MLSGPSQRSMAWILLQLCLTLAKRCQSRATQQSVHIAKTKGQPPKLKVVAFIGKIECKKYPKAVWNSISREQQMQTRKLHEQQGIKLAEKKNSTVARIVALKAQLRINSQPKKGDFKKGREAWNKQ